MKYGEASFRTVSVLIAVVLCRTKTGDPAAKKETITKVGLSHSFVSLFLYSTVSGGICDLLA